MNIEEIIAKIIAALTTYAIASLIGLIIKGRISHMVKKFFNDPNSSIIYLYFLLSMNFFISILFALFSELLVKGSFYTVFFSVFFASFLFTIIVREFVKTGKYSISYYLGELAERSRFLSLYGERKFICNVNGIDVAFYSAGKNVFFVPVDVDSIDITKWLEVEKHIKNIINHSPSVEDLKSALGCHLNPP